MVDTEQNGILVAYNALGFQAVVTLLQADTFPSSIGRLEPYSKHG